jgi:hypothetical protein
MPQERRKIRNEGARKAQMAQKGLMGLANGMQRRPKGDKRAMIGQELGKTGHEPNPDLPDGFQMTELGPLPKEWRVVRLGERVLYTFYGNILWAQ